MSDQELDAAVIKATQQSLGKYIKKPPLTEKLLRKPPFRYLMDIFSAFIRETGCFEGLYTPEEQLFENINDRNDKTRFLQKMIDVTKLTTKRELKVRTSKIVAGHEPRLTNELLQAMASVVEQQLDWRDAVQQVLASDQTELPKSKPSKAGDKPKASGKQTSPTAKEQPAQRREKRISPQEQKLRKATDQAAHATPTDKVPAAQQRRQKASPEAPKPKPKPSKQSSKQKSPSPTTKIKQQASTEAEQKSMSPAPAVKLPSPASSPKAEPPEPVKEPVKEPAKEPAKEPPPSTAAAEHAEPESRKSSSKSRRSSASQRQAAVEAVSPDPSKSPNEEQSTASASTRPDADANISEPKREREGTFTRENSKESTRPRTSLRPPSARPASARPGAPRRRNVEIVLQPNDQLKMNGINVKLETFGDFDDDGENLVVIEDAHAHDIETGTADTGALDPEANQGRLVQQILETQKELVQQGNDAGKEESQQKTQSSTTRQSSARQMNDLRDIIQTLTKSVNPLGKLLDFIPEDIDAMQLELSMWRESYTQAAAELKRERSLTASATEPMKQQMLAIEASISEYKELVDESRHKILLNNERILKMLMEQ
ncbi:TRAF3-interacting protein 1 [Drosophila novamexicana]|uniref:TRAF3-interacting protein 1 n=1 Tax=Drosophila novamexicana TaxID=47314 RepID=UPI0011E5CF68|nr:TRAF3-interacting protein 1 [Drosophila novamexicana]